MLIHVKTLILVLETIDIEQYHMVWDRLRQHGIEVYQASTGWSCPEKDMVLLTDSEKAAKSLRHRMGACIGYCPESKGSFFHGVDMVLTNLEDLDVELLEETFCHVRHLPWHVCATKRLQLREFTMSDLAFLQNISETDGTLFLEQNNDCFSQERLEAYIKTAYPFYGYGLWLVQKKQHPIGICGFGNLELESEVIPELQYYLAPEYRHQGFAEEMCIGALRFLRKHMEFTKAGIRIHPSNQASLRLAEKLGFQKLEEKEVENFNNPPSELYLEVDLSHYAC